jgi:hypothetical protein
MNANRESGVADTIPFNNAAERALRGLALGRKSWLFAGSERGAERAALMYTLIQARGSRTWPVLSRFDRVEFAPVVIGKADDARTFFRVLAPVLHAVARGIQLVAKRRKTGIIAAGG